MSFRIEANLGEKIEVSQSQPILGHLGERPPIFVFGIHPQKASILHGDLVSIH